jgi:hypothetical protein
LSDIEGAVVMIFSYHLAVISAGPLIVLDCVASIFDARPVLEAGNDDRCCNVSITALVFVTAT